jgi:hypothetical protein
MTKSCLWTVDETIDAYFILGFTYEDFRRVIFNCVYHFGTIYDRGYEMA